MKPETIRTLFDVLRDLDLLAPAQYAQLPALAAQFAEPRQLLEHLAQLGWLTDYQVEQLLTGKPELVINRYRLLDRLGEGGVCRVFKALDRQTDRVVALKVLKQTLVANTEIYRRFQREIKVALTLDHPHVVHAFDAQLSETGGFLAMEYLPGIDLQRLVQDQGPLSVPVACQFLRHAALGLQAAHEHGMVHRDIKPANLLLAADEGVVKVLDLGLARSGASVAGSTSMSVTFEGATLGTPDYMAPEQARDARNVDIRADVYALGCTLYYLLLGEPPFAGGLAMQKLFRHQREEPAPLHRLRPAVPAKLSQLAVAMLAKQTKERPSTPALVAEALAEYL